MNALRSRTYLRLYRLDQQVILLMDFAMHRHSN